MFGVIVIIALWVPILADKIYEKAGLWEGIFLPLCKIVTNGTEGSSESQGGGTFIA